MNQKQFLALQVQLIWRTIILHITKQSGLVYPHLSIIASIFIYVTNIDGSFGDRYYYFLKIFFSGNIVKIYRN